MSRQQIKDAAFGLSDAVVYLSVVPIMMNNPHEILGWAAVAVLYTLVRLWGSDGPPLPWDRSGWEEYNDQIE